MQAWWEGLSVLQQSMFVVAVTATLILFIFVLLMLFGIHGDSFDGGVDSTDFDMGGHDVDAGIHGDTDMFNHEPLSALSGLKLFTLRGVLAFLAVGGWVTFILDPYMNGYLAGLFGILAGLAAAFLLAYTFRQIFRLESEGNLKYDNAIGKPASVYIKIPAKRLGKGKITMTVQERFVEVDAITDEETPILFQEPVEVIGLENESTLIVKRSKK